MKYEIVCPCDGYKLPVIIRNPINSINFYPNNISIAKLCQKCMNETFEVIFSEYENYFSKEEAADEV
tara:strand:- start:358 stop:558 length:201 start_codon:yes stop_codon:yes gene_type:complete